MPSHPPRVAPLGAALLAALGTACARTEPEPKVPLSRAAASAAPTAAVADPLAPAARAALDAANAHFRAGRFDSALAGYTAVTRAAPENAAAYYGMFMVARKVQNAVLADSASRMIRQLASEAAPILSDSSVRAVHAVAEAEPPPARKAPAHP